MTFVRFKKNRVLFVAAAVIIALLTTATLLSPRIFLHSTRTCIPYVDPRYQTGMRISGLSTPSKRPSDTTGEDNTSGQNGPQPPSVSTPNEHKHERESPFSARDFLPPKIVILSGERCTNSDPKSKCRVLGETSYQNRRDYVTYHRGRYDLRDNFTHYFEEIAAAHPYGNVTPAWAKIKILKDELDRQLDPSKAGKGEKEEYVKQERHDWIFWIDTDAILMEMGVRLEQFLDNRYSLIITKDVNGLNAGVFFLKIDEWSRQFMNSLLQKMGPGLHEQDWMNVMLQSKMVLETATIITPEGGREEKTSRVTWDSSRAEDNVKYIPQCSFNSYWLVAEEPDQKYHIGDFAVHWAGENYKPEAFEAWEKLRQNFRWQKFRHSFLTTEE
ncbi:hypothetical protein EMPS_02207 [Entomortierella parvispora]|uniref:Glycosyltransferase family 34 protein n=1 Tax=Entomortierella parvispora TaxID=205924 RepID=A0A9P3H4C8_9FUNG|nr:hypothetical protein EMPS_02207 [Entomortierella parvispora]